jgi:hypothetical protein
LRNAVISIVSLLALVASGLALDGIAAKTDPTLEYVILGSTVIWLVAATLWVVFDRHESGKS